jgi:hypothetical protein
MSKPLSGFTLFETSRGWQLSTREVGEDGWSVRIVSDEQAEVLLALVAPSTPIAPKPVGPEDLFGKPVASMKRPRVHL